MKFNFFIYQSSSTDKDSHDQGMKRCCIDICMWSNIYLNVPTWSRCYFKLRVKQMLYVVCLWVCLPAYGPNQRLPLVSCTVAAQNRMYTLRKGSSHFHLPFPVWNVYTQTCTHTHTYIHTTKTHLHTTEAATGWPATFWRASCGWRGSRARRRSSPWPREPSGGCPRAWCPERSGCPWWPCPLPAPWCRPWGCTRTAASATRTVEHRGTTKNVF